VALHGGVQCNAMQCSTMQCNAQLGCKSVTQQLIHVLSHLRVLGQVQAIMAATMQTKLTRHACLTAQPGWRYVVTVQSAVEAARRGLCWTAKCA
jgi:hypothetical protein